MGTRKLVSAQSSVTRVLVTYAVACFVVLQVLDIALEPLGVPVLAIRWVMLIMIGFAPILVVAVTWHSWRQSQDFSGSGGEAGPAAVFRIAHAELDTAKRQIRFDGTAADVQPKVFDLIEFLIREKHRVVSKDDLFDEIWPAVVVSESSLTQSIKRARDLFRENGFDTDVIRTVPRRGYQFDHPVDVASDLGENRSGPWSDVVVPTVAVGAAAVIFGLLVWNSGGENTEAFPASHAANSLVVLPFSNFTPDSDFGYFSNGLTETLTSSLTTVRGLRVIAQGSAFSFRDSGADYATIGEELNVAHIVEGTVQRNKNELRISAKLVRAHDGYQAWSRIYSREFDDIFAVQDDISRSIVAHMSEILSASLALPDEPVDRGNADDAEAYRLYLKGLEQQKNRSADGLRAAERSFREALRLHPEYPEAMLGIANAIGVQATMGELPRERTFSESLHLVRQALQLRPGYADAFVRLGEIQHRHFWDFDDAAASYEKALALNPGDAGAHSAYGRFLSKSGRFEQSIREARIALDLDPKSARAASSLAIRLIRARQLDAAREVIDEFSKQHPDDDDLPWLETNWQIRSASYGDALKWASLEELDYLRLSLTAIALFHLDRTGQAREALDELIETDAEGAAFQIAEVFAQWNEPDNAFQWLERAFEQGDPGLAELYSSVNLENLYSDPRFMDLTDRVGLPAADAL